MGVLNNLWTEPFYKSDTILLLLEIIEEFSRFTWYGHILDLMIVLKTFSVHFKYNVNTYITSKYVKTKLRTDTRYIAKLRGDCLGIHHNWQSRQNF